MTWLWVFLGGGLGASLRYGLRPPVAPHTADGFPWATLSANMIGCFAIGALLPLMVREPLKAFWIIGLLGGFHGLFGVFGGNAASARNACGLGLLFIFWPLWVWACWPAGQGCAFMPERFEVQVKEADQRLDKLLRQRFLA